VQEQFFLDIPYVELLQWFARGSLKQNLPRAIRLWGWLRCLYGKTQERLPNYDAFTYAEWRDVFFTSTHPKGEAIPQLHDINCNCAKTLAQWLFNPKTGIVEGEWKKTLVSHVGIDEGKLNEILQQRLFGVTRRSLQADFGILAELGWLVYQNQKYYRVDEFPLYPSNNSDRINIAKINVSELNFLQEDLSAIAQNHSQQINGIQRFFVHLDYVIAKSTIDLVENWQWELKELWGQTPVPPVKLTYSSARIGNAVDCVVFPVCIYYFQRAVYLCGYGESPDRNSEWYNFRLDHIEAMNSLDWKHPTIPAKLQQRYQQQHLPNPDEIAIAIDKAWGFDFYLPARLMILRFDGDYDDRYIKNTNRHSTFTPITYQKAQSLIRRETTEPKLQKALLNVLANRSPKDAYYQVNYRHKDNAIIMRLRAWRPRCEVLFPFDLRASIAEDVAAEYQLYHTDSKNDCNDL
jgi:CRISPR-associated protein (TIGR03985 family)